METSAIDGRHQGGVALLGILAEGVVDIGFGYREENAVDHVDDSVGGLDVGFDDASSVHCYYLIFWGDKETKQRNVLSSPAALNFLLVLTSGHLEGKGCPAIEMQLSH